MGCCIGPSDLLTPINSGISNFVTTIAQAKALYPSSFILQDGVQVSIACGVTVNDGRGGVFAYKFGSTQTFLNDGIGYVDNVGRSWFRITDNNTVSASNFGVSGDGGFADQSSRIANAIQTAISLNSFISPSTSPITPPILLASAPRLILPPGVIRVSSALTADSPQQLNGLIIEGQDTILVADSGVTIFGGIGYDVLFKNLSIYGGACAFSIKTANNNTAIIGFDGVKTVNQTVANYRTDTNSNSSKISFTSTCKHYQQNTGAFIFDAQTGDQIDFTGWTETACDVSFNVNNAVFFLLNMLGVPLNGNGAWAQLHDGVGSFFSNNNRYGGDNGGGKTALNVVNTAAPGYIVFRDDQLFIAGKPWLELGAWPKYRLTARGLNAPLNTTGIAFTPSFNDAQKIYLFSDATGKCEVDPWMAGALVATGAGQEAANMLFPQIGRDITLDNVLLSVPINSGSITTTGSQNTTLTNSTDQFGNFAYLVTGTGVANDGIQIFNFPTALNGLPTGPITVYFDFEVLTSPIVLVANAVAGYRQQFFPSNLGKHFHTVHGYYDGTLKQVSVSVFSIPLGAQFKISGWRIIIGHVNPAQDGKSWLQMVANAFPVSAGYYFAGDRVTNIPIVSGQPVEWGCSAAGSSGTWNSTGNYS